LEFPEGEENNNKKNAIVSIICITLAALLSACNAQNDFVCPNGEGLTEAECGNAGTHTYQSHLEIQGIGGVDCSGEEGITKLDGTGTYTFTFIEDEGVMYEHPDELVWDSYLQPFMKTAENQYIFLGAEDNMLQTWELEFFNGGFNEKLTLTWDCANGTCGCVTTGENVIDD
jgi:hypothetical protein